MIDYVFWVLLHTFNAVPLRRSSLNLKRIFCVSAAIATAIKLRQLLLLGKKNLQIDYLWRIFVSAASSAYFISFSAALRLHCWWYCSLFSSGAAALEAFIAQLRGGQKTTFLVKVRAARAPRCLCTRATFFLLSCILTLAQPAKPQHREMQHFYFP